MTQNAGCKKSSALQIAKHALHNSLARIADTELVMELPFQLALDRTLPHVPTGKLPEYGQKITSALLRQSSWPDKGQPKISAMRRV